MTADAVSLEALAAAVQEPAERVRRWADLGLLPGDGNHFRSDAVDRASLIGFAIRRGITAEAIARICADDDVIGRFRAMIAGTGSRSMHRIADVARETGLDETVVRRLFVASGLGDQPQAFDEDVEMLRGLAVALDAGMPVDALVQVTRVLNDALTRVAEAETRLFHFYVHERLRAEGLAGAELDAASEEVSAPLQDLIEPALLYFHRKAWQRALREDMVLHLAEDVAGDDGAVGRMAVAVLFVDLANFTPMTELMGDTAAAVVIERFSDLVREAAIECDGRVLKQIGDEFMLVFQSGTQAVSCGRSIMAKAAAEQQFPDVRLGAHAGIALYREGDYLGATVNVAARVASQADQGQFLVTDAVRRELAEGVALEHAGWRSLKGVADKVELFEVVTSRASRPVDPVCGMIIDPDSCLVTLERNETRLYFCSEACRDRYCADPHRYGQASTA